MAWNNSVRLLVLGSILTTGASFAAEANESAVPSAETPSEAPVSLPGGGKVVTKHNDQTVGKSCSAKRTWIEVEGLPSETAAKRINTAIRKELTVGRKLKPSDCPEGDDAGTIEYINVASVTGVRKQSLGVETQVHFAGSGGSGTHLRSCKVYSLENGKAFSLDKALTSAGEALIAKKVCDYAKSAKDENLSQERFCKSYLEIADSLYYGFSLCLKDEGVDVRFGPANIVYVQDEVKMTDEETRKAFKIPKGLTLW